MNHDRILAILTPLGLGIGLALGSVIIAIVIGLFLLSLFAGG